MMNDPLIGVTISDQYLLTERLGAGGMGCVYRAENLKLSGRPCAIKVLLEDMGDSKSGKKRFEEELKIISQLRSPHIVQVTDKGELEDGRLFIVMELLDGEPLSAIIKREGALSLKRAIPIIQGVLAGLSEAHHQGVIHRDLKPANIFITRSVVGYEIAKVLDFGIAKSTDPNAAGLTQSQQIMGTPRYMTPEQFMQEPLTLRTDLYAVGLLFYEMLAGLPPFTKRSEQIPRDVRSLPEVIQLMWLHLNAEPPKLESVPAPIWQLCMQLLSKRQEDRPGEATLVIELLNTLKELPEPVMSEADPVSERSPSGDLARVSGAVKQVISSSSRSEVTVLTSQELSDPFGSRDYTISLAPQKSSQLRDPLVISGVALLLGVGSWFMTRPSSPTQSAQDLSLPSPTTPTSPRLQTERSARVKPQELVADQGEQPQTPMEIPPPEGFEQEVDLSQSPDQAQEQRAVALEQVDQAPKAQPKVKSSSRARAQTKRPRSVRSQPRRQRKRAQKRSQRRSRPAPPSKAQARARSVSLSLMSRGMFFTPGARLRLKTDVKPAERLGDVTYQVSPKGAAQITRGAVHLSRSLSTSMVLIKACVEKVCSLPIKIRIGLEDAPE